MTTPDLTYDEAVEVVARYRIAQQVPSRREEDLDLPFRADPDRIETQQDWDSRGREARGSRRRDRRTRRHLHRHRFIAERLREAAEHPRSPQ